jgi:hypothetical protein
VGLSLGEEIDVSNSGKWAENLGEEADLPVELSEHILGKGLLHTCLFQLLARLMMIFL